LAEITLTNRDAEGKTIALEAVVFHSSIEEDEPSLKMWVV